jgi:hypothetical protein
MMIPTAMSITLPRIANSLNSLNIALPPSIDDFDSNCLNDQQDVHLLITWTILLG